MYVKASFSILVCAEIVRTLRRVKHIHIYSIQSRRITRTSESIDNMFMFVLVQWVLVEFIRWVICVLVLQVLREANVCEHVLSFTHISVLHHRQYTKSFVMMLSIIWFHQIMCLWLLWWFWYEHVSTSSYVPRGWDELYLRSKYKYVSIGTCRHCFYKSSKCLWVEICTGDECACWLLSDKQHNVRLKCLIRARV